MLVVWKRGRIPPLTKMMKEESGNENGESEGVKGERGEKEEKDRNEVDDSALHSLLNLTRE